MSYFEQFLKNRTEISIENDFFIFPSNRSLGTFKRIIASQTTGNWLPECYTLNELVSEFEPEQTTSTLSKLNAMYHALNNQNKNHQGGELKLDFLSQLISDFEEVQREQLNYEEVFSQVAYIKMLEKWDLDKAMLGKNGQNTVDFWSKLHDVFKSYQQLLESNQLSSSPRAIFRLEDNNLFQRFLRSKSKCWVLGFNNFNRSEEYLFSTIRAICNLEVIFDFDDYYLRYSNGSASWFLNKTMKSIKLPYSILNANWEKNDQQISHYSVGGNVEQLNVIFRNLENRQAEYSTAVVFLDQKIIDNAIFQLPKSLLETNIGVGVGLKSSAVFGLVDAILQRDAERFEQLVQFIPHRRTTSRIEQEQQIFESANFIDQLDLIENWISDVQVNSGNQSAAQYISACFQAAHGVLLEFKKALQHNIKLPEEWLKHQLHTDLGNASVNTVSDQQSKIQFLGLLETRAIDFDYTILVSFNENVFPGNFVSKSIIPQDVRGRFGLATTADKEGLLSYYFYQCIQRSKKIDFLSIQSDQGFGSSEPSRFINQLSFNHINFKNKLKSFQTTTIGDELDFSESKSIFSNAASKEVILTYLTEKGCSASALNLLIRNPIDFYCQYVLKLKEPDQPEDSISHSELGTLFHNVLEELYKPCCGKFLTSESLLEIEKKYSRVLESKLKELKNKLNPDPTIFSLYENICSSWLRTFISFDKRRVANGNQIKLMAVEEPCEAKLQLELENKKVDITIAGTIDRVESLNNETVLIDYKTGLVAPKDLKIEQQGDTVVDPTFSKANQLMFYSLLYSNKIDLKQKLRCGIYSTRNSIGGILPLKVDGVEQISEEVINQYSILFKEKLEQLCALNFEFESSEEFYSKYLTTV